MSSTKKSTKKSTDNATTQDATTQDNATFTLTVDPATPRTWEQIREQIEQEGIVMSDSRLISPASLKRAGLDTLRTLFKILTGTEITSDSVTYVASQVAQNATFARCGADPALAAILKGSTPRSGEPTARCMSFSLPVPLAERFHAYLRDKNPDGKKLAQQKREFVEAALDALGWDETLSIPTDANDKQRF